MEYKLITIKDIFDLVPTNRIGICMHELTALIIQSAALRDLIKTAADTEKTTINEAFSFPEEVFWTDDDEGNIDLILRSSESNEELLTIHTKLSSES